jgi:magnesium chelatase family protein
MLVAATNPCPCGHAGETDRCRCSEAEIARHRRRLSGPLLDRMDLLIAVPRPSADDLAAAPVTTSARARERVLEARERQARRLAGTEIASNARLTPRLLRRHALSGAAESALRDAHDRARLSARGRQRVLRVARTVADLDRAEHVTAEHVLRALALRQHEPGEDADHPLALLSR